METIHLGRRAIEVQVVTSFGEEGNRRTPSWEESVYRDASGKLYLHRASWRGRMCDQDRRKNCVRVRRLGEVGALLWFLKHMGNKFMRHEPKLTRQFWNKVKKGGVL